MPFETALNNLAAEVPGVTGLLHLTTLGINGPTNVTGPGDTPSRRKIFVCRPASRRKKSLVHAGFSLRSRARRSGGPLTLQTSII